MALWTTVGGSLLLTKLQKKYNISPFKKHLHTVEKLEFFVQKKLGSSYSKIIQLRFSISKLDFRDLKLKID